MIMVQLQWHGCTWLLTDNRKPRKVTSTTKIAAQNSLRFSCKRQLCQCQWSNTSVLCPEKNDQGANWGFARSKWIICDILIKETRSPVALNWKHHNHLQNEQRWSFHFSFVRGDLLFVRTKMERWSSCGHPWFWTRQNDAVADRMICCKSWVEVEADMQQGNGGCVAQVTLATQVFSHAVPEMQFSHEVDPRLLWQPHQHLWQTKNQRELIKLRGNKVRKHPRSVVPDL